MQVDEAIPNVLRSSLRAQAVGIAKSLEKHRKFIPINSFKTKNWFEATSASTNELFHMIKFHLHGEKN